MTERLLVLHRPEDAYAAGIAASALVRSFSAAQVAAAEYGAANVSPRGAVMVNPGDSERSLLRQLLNRRAKLLVLGRLGPAIAAELGLRLDSGVEIDPHWAEAPVALTESCGLSLAAVQYADGHPLAQAAPAGSRHFCRYDFSDEWNNLGYGRITADGSAWSLAVIAAFDGATPIASVRVGPDRPLCAYAALHETKTAAALWYNRLVGPVDSLEWCVVERFLGDYRPDDLPCFPYLSEVPAGYAGAVTMRLDCDQAVASARPLFEIYASKGLPFSLAVSTGLPLSGNDRDLIREVARTGGAIVSHSVDHPQNWGADYEAALHQATASRKWLEENFPECRPVRHAVSPFHSNPPYSVQALADAGYHGFVGGSIRQDPEFLLGRAGRVPLVSKTIVSHSQQCMLHGDCYHRYGNKVLVYRQSFDEHCKARAIFGYLDHPTSPSYSYGWASESERISAHAEFLDYVLSRNGLWRCNLNECLDFVRARDTVMVWLDEDERLMVKYLFADNSPAPAILWKGQSLRAPARQGNPCHPGNPA